MKNTGLRFLRTAQESWGQSIPPAHNQIAYDEVKKDGMYPDVVSLKMGKAIDAQARHVISKHLDDNDTMFKDPINNEITPFDRDTITATRPLSYLEPAYNAVDFDKLNEGLKSKPVSKRTVDRLIDFYMSTKRSKNLNSPKEKGISISRGKNIGWPIPVSGMNRIENDVMLSILGHFYDQEGDKGREILANERFWGQKQPFFMYSERFQHTGKEVPYFTNQFATRPAGMETISPRVRWVNMSGKFDLIAYRPYVKWFMSIIRESEMSQPDPALVDVKINKWAKQKWKVFAADYSRFDKVMSGEFLLDVAKVIGKVLNNNGVEQHILKQWSEPMFVPSRRTSYSMDIQGRYPQSIPSGSEWTSVGGNVANALTLFEAFGRNGVKRGYELEYGKDWDCMIWGDDTLIALPPDSRLTVEDFTRFFANQRVSVEQETAFRYLGRNIDERDYVQMDDGFFHFTTNSPRWYYPVSRFEQNTFFPERPRILASVSSVGLLARLHLRAHRMTDSEVNFCKKTVPPELSAGLKFDGSQEDIVEMSRFVAEDMMKHSAALANFDDIIGLLGNYSDDTIDSILGVDVTTEYSLDDMDRILHDSKMTNRARLMVMNNPYSAIREIRGYINSLSIQNPRYSMGDVSRLAISKFNTR